MGETFVETTYVPRVQQPRFIAPHFDLPFRFRYDGAGGSAVCVEEGQIDDLANVAFLMVATPLGYRDEAIDFGIPDLVFRKLPVMASTIQQLMISQDQRIEFAFSEDSPGVDELLRRLRIAVARRVGV